MGGFLSGRNYGSKIQTSDLADDAVTLAKMAGGTDGNLITFDTSGDPDVVAVGADSQVLTSSGAGAVPAFEALPASGGLRLISTTDQDAGATAVSSIDFTGLTADYDTYMIRISDLHPSVDNSGIHMRMGDSGGFDSGASDYAWGWEGDNFNDATHDSGVLCDDADGEIAITQTQYNGKAGNATGEGTCATIWMNHGRNNDMAPTVTFHCSSFGNSGLTGSGMAYVVGAGGRLAEIDVDRISFFFSTGNIVSGRISLYALANS
tara:strand:- start:153 stop:941 length:789 start_codon:yes stop_codon:yes gene_type:complete